MDLTFRDRHDAGRRLGARLAHLSDEQDLLVLALPRGGVPVAAEVAAALAAPLDVYFVRKLGLPGRPELAMGAIASGGVRVMNEDVLAGSRTSSEAVEALAREEERELEHRERALRGERPAPATAGRTVVLVDDGVATGSTMRAAITALRALGTARIVVGVPLAAPETCRELEHEADEVVCVATPEPLAALSLWYDDFTQTTDEEVRELLERAAREGPGAPEPP